MFTIALFIAAALIALAGIIAGPWGFGYLMVAVGLFAWALDRWMAQRERTTRAERKRSRRCGYIA